MSISVLSNFDEIRIRNGSFSFNLTGVNPGIFVKIEQKKEAFKASFLYMNDY